MYLLFNMTPIFGLVGLATSIVLAVRHKGGFGKKEVLKYSALIGTSLAVTGYGLLFYPTPEYIFYDLPGLFLGCLGLTLIVMLQWLFSRYVAKKAEEAGRSYVAFLVLSVLFPLIALIIVLLFQPNSNTSTTSHVQPATGSLTEDLAKLQSLKDSGVLSEEEFRKAKEKLLS